MFSFLFLCVVFSFTMIEKVLYENCKIGPGVVKSIYEDSKIGPRSGGILSMFPTPDYSLLQVIAKVVSHE